MGEQNPIDGEKRFAQARDAAAGQAGTPDTAAPRAMRRANREVCDLEELRGIVERAQVLRVASHDDEGLFIVPLSFGFEVGEGGSASAGADAGTVAGARWTFWLHSASEGRKADAWRADPQVALELDAPRGVIEGDYACAYSLAYQSVMASGRIVEVTDNEQKVRGLTALMDHAAPGAPVRFSPAALDRVSVWRIDVDRLTGKQRCAKSV